MPSTHLIMQYTSRKVSKGPESITLELGSAALQDVPGHVVLTVWKGRGLEQR